MISDIIKIHHEGEVIKMDLDKKIKFWRERVKENEKSLEFCKQHGIDTLFDRRRLEESLRRYRIVLREKNREK